MLQKTNLFDRHGRVSCKPDFLGKFVMAGSKSRLIHAYCKRSHGKTITFILLFSLSFVVAPGYSVRDR